MSLGLGLALLLFALALTFWTWWSETRALETLAAPASRAEAVKRLPGALGEAAAALDRAIQAKKGVDEALSTAIGLLGRPDVAGVGVRAVFVDLCVILGALSPLGAALFEAAEHVTRIQSSLHALTGPAAYVAAVDAIPGAFAALPGAAATSAVLGIVAAAVGAVRYALLRDEAREARAVRALLNGAAAAIPDVTAPKTAKLLRLITPSTSLRPAVAASLAFVALSAGAVGVLSIASELRRANAVPLSYEGWTILHIESGEVKPPFLAAGRSLAAGPSLIVGRDRVQLGAQTVTGLDEGKLIKGWETQTGALNVSERSRPLLVASPSAELGTLHGIMRFLVDKGAQGFQLVIDRRLPRSQGTPTQAAIPLALGEVGDGPTTIDVTPTGVRIDGSAVKLAQLRERVAAAKAARFGVRASLELSYGQLAEVLAAADGVCEGDSDCGLPGRGLEFVFQPSAE